MNAPKMQCTLDALPVELKIMILSQIDKRKTLFKMIIASPAYYDAFKAAQREIMTSVWLQERQDVLDPAYSKEMRVHGRYFRTKKLLKFQTAIEMVRKKRREGSQILLDVEQCLALLAIPDYLPVRWDEDFSDLEAYCQRRRTIPQQYLHVYFATDN